MLKPHILFDNTKTSKKIKNFLEPKIKNISLGKCNLIIVIGGDGFMLSALKKYNKYKKPFYGINGGSYGFLMNKFSSRNTIKNLSKAKLVIISPLEMIVKNKFNKTKKSIAINEVSILRQSRQTASLEISNGSQKIIKKLVSDGILVSTPAGSTAYNMSVYGPILNLDSNKLSIRPISAVADNVEVRNAKSISIKTNKKIKFNLIFDKNRSLQKKIKIEQLRNETN